MSSAAFKIVNSDVFSNNIRNTSLFSTSDSSVNEIVFGDDDVIMIFVMGQSNAKGSGENLAVPFTATNVFCLPLDGTTFIPFDSTNRLFSYSLGGTENIAYSPSYALAKNWQDRIDGGADLPDLYVVGVGQGSQGIDSSFSVALRGWASNGHLPDKSVEAFNVALSALTTLGKRVYFAGTFWLQGETHSDASAPKYLSNFMALYQLWKNTIGTDHFIWFTKLTKDPTETATIQINKAYDDFALYAQSRAGAYVFDMSQTDIFPFTFGATLVHYNKAALDFMANIITSQILVEFTTKELRLISSKTVSDPQPVPLVFTAANYPVSSPLRIQGLSSSGQTGWAHNITTNGSDQKYIEAQLTSGSALSFLKPNLPSDMIDGQVEFSLPAGAPTGIGAAFRVQPYSPGFRSTNVSFLGIIVNSSGDIFFVAPPAIGGNLSVILAFGSLNWPGSAFRVRFRVTGSISTTGGFLFEGETSTDNFATTFSSFSSNQTDADDFIPPSGRDDYETGGLGIVYGLSASASETQSVELYEVIFSVTK